MRFALAADLVESKVHVGFIKEAKGRFGMQAERVWSFLFDVYASQHLRQIFAVERFRYVVIHACLDELLMISIHCHSSCAISYSIQHCSLYDVTAKMSRKSMGVIPAKAGIQFFHIVEKAWIAFFKGGRLFAVTSCILW